MSDYDGGDYPGGYDNAHVDTANENYDLDQAHQAYGNEHDAAQAYDAYGQEHNYENDQHYANGHHVEYDSPKGEHFEETEYTNYDGHVAESDAAYGEHYAATEHDASYQELDYLREHFDAEFAHADFAHGDYGHEIGDGYKGDAGYEGGEQHLSAVNK